MFISFIFIIFASALTAAACSFGSKKAVPAVPDIFENAKFQSQSFIYDGSEHGVFVTDAPDGTKITYSGNYATKVGEYRAFAYLEKDGKDKVITTTFSINRADIAGVALTDLTAVYDGELKSIAVSGSVPEGVAVAYTTDGKPFTGVKDVGVYVVTASFSSEFYNPLTLSATVTINKAEIKGVSFPNKNFVYDGGVKTSAVEGQLPSGTKVTYTNEDGSEFTGKTLPGTYNVNAAIDGVNYNTLVLSAVLFIDKATITGINFAGYSAVYDALPHGIQINGTLPNGVSVKYTLDSENGFVFENAVERGVYNVVATLTGEYYKKLTLTATIIITPGRLATVTGISLDRTGEESSKSDGKTGVVLSWNSVPNAASYDVYIFYTDGTQAMKFNVAGLNCDIKDKIFTALNRDKYNIQIMAMPAGGDESYAPSLLSAVVLYAHKGRLHAPANVKIQGDRLMWDAVADADMYEIRMCLLDASGAVVRSWQGGQTTLTNESVTDIVNSYKRDDNIPAGTYCFQIRAATAYNGYWVGIYASNYSEYSAGTVTVS
jgi:hypothetical protein